MSWKSWPMFNEIPFDEEQDEQPTVSSSSFMGSSGGPSSSGTIIEKFHRPGEAGFCAVAGAQHDTFGAVDARTVNGDSWVSVECHCTRCECLRFITRVHAFEPSRTVVVLLDLDNFGFNQLKSVAPKVASDSGMNVLEHIFVWCFFGSCFARHHKLWPNEETVCARLPNTTSTRQTIWERLVADKRTLFTPCGGQSQGADCVIADVLPMVINKYRAILVSGDRLLLKRFAPPTRPIGRKSKRENEEHVLAQRLSLLDVDEVEKRFVPFWVNLNRFVERFLEQDDALSGA